MSAYSLHVTEAQARVLIFMLEHGQRWYPAIELERVRLLVVDDEAALPALAEMGLVIQRVSIRAAALTPLGATIAGEIKEKKGAP